MTTDEQREQRRAYYLRYRERISRQQREYYEHYRRSDAGKAVKRREQAKLRRIPAPRGGIPWTTADDAIVCRADLTLFEMAEMSPDRGTWDSPGFNRRSPDIQRRLAAAVLSHHRNTPAKTPKVYGHRRTQMNTTRFARYFALPIVSAGIIGGAALGLASTASAADTDVSPPAIVATPDVKAHPAPEAMPGWRWHHGIYQLEDLQPGYTR